MPLHQRCMQLENRCADSDDQTGMQVGDVGSLDEFEGLFRGAHFYKGMEMVFTNTKRGDLALRIDGKEVCDCPPHATFGCKALL